MNKIVFVALAILLLLLPLAGATAQEGIVIPELNITPKTIPDTEGLRFVRDMKLGWNLGNTFDAYIDDPWFSDELEYESAWCGVKTSEELLYALKATGFSTIRIPVSWHDHVSGEDFKISDRWLARVKEVVTAALGLDFKVILNIHHDNVKGFYYPSSEYLDTSTAYITRIWTQLADAFGEFGDSLLFECINEPRLSGTSYEWNLSKISDTCIDSVECINQLNQTFVDTVRRSGGNNATRYLLVPGYCASLDGVINAGFHLPADTAQDRLIVSVHAYTPYAFALQAMDELGSTNDFSFERRVGLQDVSYLMTALYNKFVANGVPVLMGEFGSRDKGGNLQARVEHAAYYVAIARANGISCCWWDNNAFTGNGENFGLIDRKTVAWTYPVIVDAMMRYAE